MAGGFGDGDVDVKSGSAGGSALLHGHEARGRNKAWGVERDARKRSSRGLPCIPSAHGSATGERGSKVRKVVKS